MPTVVGFLTLTVIKATAAARAGTVLVKVVAAVAAVAVTKAVARHLGTVSQAKIVVAGHVNNTPFSVVLTNSPLNNVCSRR